MSRLLFVVEDSFELQSVQRLVLAPGPCGDARVKVGTAVELRRPDGSRLRTTIAGIEIVCGPNLREPRTIPLALSADLKKADVPVGTEVWLDD